MSSRALRRLQREQTQLAELQKTSEAEEIPDEEDEPAVSPVQPIKKNAFDFLHDAGEDGDEEVEAGDLYPKPISQEDHSAEGATPPSKRTSASNVPNKKKGKKKKKAGKGRALVGGSDPPTADKASSGDEIDIALRSLAVEEDSNAKKSDEKPVDPVFETFYELLAVETKHLNPLNEMKRLFGSSVLDGEGGSATSPVGRRRRRGPQQLDLGGALAGRNSPASRGQGLAGLALRRNVFMLGKEEWPKATSGGLGMELVEKARDGTTEYRFVHNKQYQDVQRQFNQCVESMDPQRMITLLQVNPYHISTLLQVSEIAKHQGDHSVSADLLERALFTFGRSVHTSFHTALAEGRARLDFRRPENRELWLTAHHYIGSLGQRGTWRTAFEWAKLLLGLDPEGDPYCMHLIIDQLAIRGGQYQRLIDLATSDNLILDLGQISPNMMTSLGLAYHKLKRPKEARKALSKAMEWYPWLFPLLFKELNIEHIPKSIWGKEARNNHEKLEATAYVVRAKDIWNVPEALSFLVEIAETAELGSPLLPKPDALVSEDEARHVLLSGNPSLINLVPRHWTASSLSASDPLPPLDNLLSYDVSGRDREDEPDDETEVEALGEQPASSVQSWLNRFYRVLLSERRRRDPEGEPSGEGSERDAVNVERALDSIEHSGLTNEELATIGAGREWIEEIVRHPEAIMHSPDTLENARNMEQYPIASDQDLRAAELPYIQASSSSRQAEEIYDDQANQRWLAGRGMLRLKDFIAAHGSDPDAWKADDGIDQTPVTEYVERTKRLERGSSREFILNYALKQGAGAEATELIRRMLEMA